jgi:crossover junction endodeoxyribonuclease RuvC
MAVERVLFQNNVRTAMSVGQASGLALTVAAKANVSVTHYSPNEVKLAVVGYGAADKHQVQTMVARLLNLDAVPSPPDAADALALAVCHLWGAPLRQQTEAPIGAGAPGDAAESRFEAAVAAALAKEGTAG